MSSFLFDAYRRADIEIVKGRGLEVWDQSGRRYLDFMGGVAVLALGHCHPALIGALERQARQLWHASNLVRTPGAERLAQRLVEVSFADAVFFNSTGSEAVDLALKLVRRKYSGCAGPARWRVITMDGAYHGRTLATIAAGGSEKLTKGFDPVIDGFDRVRFGDLDAVRDAIGPHTAGIMLELVQGDGGLRSVGQSYIEGLRDIADRHGLLLILDEVQTGLGRTGHLFAHERFGIVPDILAMGKGIGAGFPLAGVLATRSVACHITPGSHGGTLAGAPLGMAVGNAVLDVLLEQGFLNQVRSRSALLGNSLSQIVERFPGVFTEKRGMGLMLGLKCSGDQWEVADRLRKNGLLVAPASDNVIRLLPPLVVSEAEIGEAIDIINETALVLSKSNEQTATGN